MRKAPLTSASPSNHGRGTKLLQFAVLAGLLLCTKDTGYAESLGQALRAQAADALPLTRFYDTPVPLPPGNPGDLIDSKLFDGYQTPPGVTAVRILYHSRSATGRDVASSGVVLIPYGNPPAGGWPIIAWAHGTSGIARICGPSVMRDVYYSWEGLFEFPMLGYAVVATDYTGLGTNFPHQYLAMDALAQDVINSVRAARAVLPQLSPKWVTVGHSQGGFAVLRVAELESQIQDPNYLGAVALAPATDLMANAEYIAQNNPVGDIGLFPYIAFSIKSVFPQFEFTEMLSREAAARIGLVEHEYCLIPTLIAFGTKKTLAPDWVRDDYVQKYFAENRPYLQTAFGPIFVGQGLADIDVLPSITASAVSRMCKEGDIVEYKTYPHLDHDGLVFGSFSDQIRWIQARFAGAPAESNCR
jgi:pimeloyl-ACP methyl ester carboxylesterase